MLIFPPLSKVERDRGDKFPQIDLPKQLTRYESRPDLPQTSQEGEGECMLALLFLVVAVLSVVGALAIVVGLYLLARRWL